MCRPLISRATTGVGGAVDVALCPTQIFWLNAGNHDVMTGSRAGGTATILSAGTASGGIAVDTASVYWTDNSKGTVMKMPLGGGTATVLASGQASPNAIAVDATHVYWGNSGDGTIRRVPK